MSQYRDRAEDSLFSLVGDLPELIRNLLVAEIDSGKSWVRKISKDAGAGIGWLGAAAFFAFWSVAALGAFAIIGLASWMPLWVSSLAVLIVLLLGTAILAIIGIKRLGKVTTAKTPVAAVIEDVKEVRNEF